MCGCSCTAGCTSMFGAYETHKIFVSEDTHKADKSRELASRVLTAALLCCSRKKIVCDVVTSMPRRLEAQKIDKSVITQFKGR